MIISTLPILAPLATLLIIVLLRRGAAWVALCGSGAGAVGALVTLVRVAAGARFATTVPGLPTFPLRLVVDPLAALLLAVVSVVVLVVLVFAVGYMGRDPDQPRFFAEMLFFAAAMATLVLAGDWILLLAAWELIGVASYLLIGFWYARPAPPPAATRAFLTTRSADLGLYLAVFLLVTRRGTTAIAPTLHAGGTTATVAGLLLLLAAMGKAAQTPFQGWLADAMAGPTPVSALLHSATLVAAGAILLARAFPLLPASVLVVVGLVGGLTAVVTGVTALAQPDLKRLLAASTSSQLGLMLLALGSGSPAAAIGHLVAHAAIKSALFLGAGMFQEAYESTEFADLAGAGRAHPRVFAGFALAGLSLAAVPPLAGFWSKGAIEAAALASPHAWLFLPLALAGTGLTGAYVARALLLLWRGTAARSPVAGETWMGGGLGVLVLLAAMLGLAIWPIGRLLGLTIPADPGSVLLGLGAAAVGLYVGWRFPSGRLLGPVAVAAERGFRLGGGYTTLVARPVLTLASAADRLDWAIHRAVLGAGGAILSLGRVARRFDERGIETAIANVVGGIRDLGGRARALQSGLISGELVITLGGAAILATLLLLVR